ncbi:2-oxoglutarate dehydrogenase complex dihydrolipoyllysine-residue succinyltransferase [Brenneria populi subsp. brevivirga]|uniref:2-oxoglutarate dehydrogenase complex dihydrolipoyllysine-residue succinyltransferase n=1 Tax=Brenneria populi TaxID=1505588 RepID=UPI002E17F4EF|nr:2-oxoglutarate dehydrogenase complex dihydrolipoyllysine-residue succinyltransferase [Brenneria populi subsp. brevivirga]
MIEINVPQLPESVTEGTLATWCKQVGDAVKRDDVVAELETDKVILEIPSPADGVLAEQLVAEGENVVSNQLLARIAPQGAVPAAPSPATAAQPEEKIAMPAARQEARRQDIDLQQVAGSGRDGRILKEDVLTLANQTPAPVPTAPTAVPPAVHADSRRDRREPMTRLRTRIAERLLASQRENAILTTFNEVNMQEIITLRNTYKAQFEKQHGTKLGFMSFFVKAAAHALRQFPIVNASIDGQDVIWRDYCDIGIAVSSARGLVVPILRDAQALSLAEIERQISDYAEQARAGKLPLEALQGGTFSITNGGTFGSMMSTPIINPPQSAILGMHAITPRPVAENGAVVIRPMMYLALSYDHRLIDGQEAVQTLATIKRLLEAPAQLLLDI